MEKKYEVRYLPLFQEDLIEIVDYISRKLKNPSAASALMMLWRKPLKIVLFVQNPLNHTVLRRTEPSPITRFV